MNFIKGQKFTVKNKTFEVKEVWMKNQGEVDYYIFNDCDTSQPFKATHSEIQERIHLISSWTLLK